jgi:hypothetical protein
MVIIILELVGHYDPVLKERLNNIKKSERSPEQLQVHHLSPDIHNEFIQCCADKVTYPEEMRGMREKPLSTTL